MSKKVIKGIRVNDGYQARILNEGYQARQVEKRGYQGVNNGDKLSKPPKPPKTGSVIDVPKSK